MLFPSNFTPLADKKKLLAHYKSQNVSQLPTPAFVTNERKFKAYIKTYKTLEGTAFQLGEGELSTKKVVVSTLMEAWSILTLVEQGKIDDILFSLPVVESRLGELATLSDKVPNLRLMLDNVNHLYSLHKYNVENNLGATPTAHASEIVSCKELGQKFGILSRTLELHAGNYPFCDLQQVATGCVTMEDVSVRLIADVISSYSNRGPIPPGEILINSGVIALAREFGPIHGHGKVANPGYENWIVSQLSQEHDILSPLDEKIETKLIPLGTKVNIIPQHSCITASAHPFFFIVDDDDFVIDIWVPNRGW